ncbi:MAG: DUF368 domain-containing protein [Bacteroidetes bacterium]|nr:DUF368 domain-containing protein [Bacteroidota bacterium]
MGMADVVPGVSGGTIAFISGIYEELVSSLKSIGFKTVRLLLTGRFREFQTSINLWFLLSVFGGVAISIFSLAKLMKWLLHNHPVLVWSFFFGLILASTLFVLKTIGKFNARTMVFFVTGIAVAWLITSLSPVNTPEEWWFVFLSGSIGICAMILPGISGAFILLLMGKYLFIITAVSELNIPVILVFAAGAITGLILFSHALSWLLRRYRMVTVALLAGFMIGSLNKVWPWKIATSTAEGLHGEVVILAERNVSPAAYESITSSDPMIPWAILLFIAGIGLLSVLQLAGQKAGK